ncbi:hypothetical protein B5E80_07300 [Flavonifractor sp. An135]|nr:hypothetical protein [Flavonifractor sp. An135]OUQ24344.1 hypothetical protein B5E80_07300 [Flavonifractor sp. An135]
MDFSKNLFFTRKKQLTLALKSYILQRGNSNLQHYYRSAEEIAGFICEMQPAEQDDYHNLAAYIQQWTELRGKNLPAS